MAYKIILNKLKRMIRLEGKQRPFGSYRFDAKEHRGVTTADTYYRKAT
jgi:hypothetical protein